MSNNFLHTHLKEQDKDKLEVNMSWAFSLMSDAQELMAMGSYSKARDTLNNAKKILLGKYTEGSNGFTIEVTR